MGQLSKVAVPASTGGGPGEAGPRTHPCAHYLPLGGDLIEELRELCCHNAVPAGECKNKGWEQPRSSQVTVSAGIHAKWAGLGNNTTQTVHIRATTRAGLAHSICQH